MVSSSDSSPSFVYTIDKCDIADREALVAYRVKRHEWLQWLQNDPHNSINHQLYGMMWDDAAFRALNEARRFGSPANPTGAVAPLLAGLLDQGFVATQVLAIARLVDKRADVISLRRLLDDIEAHAHLITREIFVCYDGLPFDAAAAEAAYWEREGLPVSGRITSLPTEGPDAFDTACLAHDAFDRIARPRTGPPSRVDRIDPVAFVKLRGALAQAEVTAIVQLRHKFIAHAADRASREKVGIERFGITLDQLEVAQRVLIQTAQNIEIDLLWGSSRGVVSVPQYDQFAHLELPIVPADRFEELGRWWHAHCDTRDAWTRSSN